MLAFSMDAGKSRRHHRSESGRDRRTDGIAERELAAMQGQLQETLKSRAARRSRPRGFQDQPRHAQHPRLRAADVRPPVDGRDPMVQRFAPKLLRTLDRAVSYSKMCCPMARPARRRRTPPLQLRALVRDVEELLGIDRGSGIEFSAACPGTLRARRRQRATVPHDLQSVPQFRAGFARRHDDPATVKRLSIPAGTAWVGGPDQRRGYRAGPAGKRRARTCFPPSRARRDRAAPGWAWPSPMNWCAPMAARSNCARIRGIGAHFEISLPDAPVSLDSGARAASGIAMTPAPPRRFRGSENHWQCRPALRLSSFFRLDNRLKSEIRNGLRSRFERERRRPYPAARARSSAG
jgi:hypothetical protein